MPSSRCGGKGGAVPCHDIYASAMISTQVCTRTLSQNWPAKCMSCKAHWKRVLVHNKSSCCEEWPAVLACYLAARFVFPHAMSHMPLELQRDQSSAVSCLVVMTSSIDIQSPHPLMTMACATCLTDGPGHVVARGGSLSLSRIREDWCQSLS